MKQKEPFIYTASPDEMIGIEIEPIRLSAQVRAAQNGQAIAASGPSIKPLFEFTVTEPPGNSHFVMIWFQFPAHAPNNASYDVTVHGTHEGEPVSEEDRPITNRGPRDQPAERRMVYDFRVE
jgi:hypothetical protein